MLWVLVPLVIGVVGLLVMFIEFRVGLQFFTTVLDINWQLPDARLGAAGSKLG